MPVHSSTKAIERLVDQHLRPLGFIKKGKKWIRTGQETLCHVGLQRSGHQHYLNFGVSVLQLNANGQSSEPVWHIIGRRFSPDVAEKIEWEKCLNALRSVVFSKPREVRLAEILCQKIVPFLQTLESIQTINKALVLGQLRGMGIRTELQDFLGFQV